MESQYENVVESLSLAVAVGSVAYSRYLHGEELKKAQERHKESINLAKGHHEKEILESKRHYLLELFTNLEQHFQQLNADLLASSKESERDMFDQRNQSLQTIILASSVMFGALTTAIVNGVLPGDSSDEIIIAYSASCSFSFAFLFLSMVICMELVVRTSKFMYNRANRHAGLLKDALEQAEEIMDDLKKDSAFITKMEEKDSAFITKMEEKDSAFITKMEEKVLEVLWEKHEGKINDFFQKREKIHEGLSMLTNSKLGQHTESTTMSFDDFWKDSCKRWSESAIALFYLGTLSLLIAIMIFMWAKFSLEYQSTVSATIAIVLLGFALFLAVLLVIYFRINDINKSNQ